MQATTYHKVINEPGHRGTDHGLPVALDDQQIGNLLFHGVLLVLGRVDKAQTHKEKGDRQHQADTKADAPQAITGLVAVSRKNNQDDDACKDKAQIDGEVGGDGGEHAAAASDLGILVCRLRSTGSAGRVLAYTSVALAEKKNSHARSRKCVAWKTYLRLRIQRRLVR